MDAVNRPMLSHALRVTHRWAYRLWIGILATKAALLVALLCLIGLNAAVQRAHAAEPTPVAPDYAKAYALAMRCFVASGADDPQARSRAAFDAAVKLGRAQGFENARINVDFDWAISRETQKLSRDTAYKTATLATCRKFGWAGS